MSTSTTNGHTNRASRRHPDKVVSPLARRYISILETADYLGVTERTVRQMIADGRLTGYRMAKSFIRLDANEIDAAMTPYGGSVTASSAGVGRARTPGAARPPQQVCRALDRGRGERR